MTTTTATVARSASPCPEPHLPICDAFLRAAQEYGIPYNPDFNGARQAGAGFYQLTQRDVRRSSAATAYLRPAEARPNLTVRTGAQVLRIVLRAGRAAGVEVAQGGQATTSAPTTRGPRHLGRHRLATPSACSRASARPIT